MALEHPNMLHGYLFPDTGQPFEGEDTRANGQAPCINRPHEGIPGHYSWMTQLTRDSLRKLIMKLGSTMFPLLKMTICMSSPNSRSEMFECGNV